MAVIPRQHLIGRVVDPMRSRWLTIVAAVCFVIALAIAIIAVLAAASLVREYGPAEGYGNLALQVLPIVVAGIVVAGLMTWLGTRLTRRRRQ